MENRDITVIYPGAMPATYISGGSWAYAQWDEQVGYHYSYLNNTWLIPAAAHMAKENEKLYLVPATIQYKELPEQYIIVSDSILRKTLGLLTRFGHCIWECEKREPRQIVHVRTRDEPSGEGRVLAGELKACTTDDFSENEFQHALDMLKNNPQMDYFLIGRFRNGWIFLDIFRRDYLEIN